MHLRRRLHRYIEVYTRVDLQSLSIFSLGNDEKAMGQVSRSNQSRDVSNSPTYIVIVLSDV